MKNTFTIILILIMFSPAICFSKEKTYSYELEFGNPAAKKILQVGGNGNLNITGYSGNKVLISANEDVFEKDTEVNEKAKGLKKIGGGGFNIINNKKDNLIIISRSITGMDIDLTIKVPNNITLRLGSGGSINRQELKRQRQELKRHAGDFRRGIEKYKSTGNDVSDNLIPPGVPFPVAYTPAMVHGIIQGNIFIKDLTGTIEAKIINGNVSVENIDGEVTASSVEGNINIVFNKLNKDNALYFSTVNGEVDITLPEKTAADIVAKTLNGNVYSGFGGESTTENVAKEDTGTSGPQDSVSNIIHSNYVTSRINGGGQEIYLSTINGNIYIRKGK